jgi:predicted SprT family Zn-dependent metalloprotease
MMTDITGERKNHRCHNYDTNGLRRKQTKKVQWICAGCGKNGWRVRMPKANRRDGYTCRGCGGKVKFVDMSSSPLIGSSSKVKIF